MYTLYLLIPFTFLTLFRDSLSLFPVPNPDLERDFSHWHKLGLDDIKFASHKKINNKVAKNVILFVGDGLGLTVSTAARIYKGQMEGNSGEEHSLIWEKFPNMGLLKTYNLDEQVTESASAATAMFSGVKVKGDTLGLNGWAEKNNCSSSLDPSNHVETILTWAQEQGKDTGLVTNTRVTHATPASLYAHSAYRSWECDSSLIKAGQDGRGCKDIARQLIEDAPGKNMKIILGGGSQTLGFNAPPCVNQSACSRSDERDLVAEWMSRPQSVFVNTSQDLGQLDLDADLRILGLFNGCHLGYEYYNKKTKPRVIPSLAELTTTAINRLRKNDNGFFLMVEGGMLDMALHYGKVRLAMEEVVALDQAVSAALNLVDLEETLIIVAGDHSHAITMNGGTPPRGNDILGLVHNKWSRDKLPYTTLTFATGPGYNFSVKDGEVHRGNVSAIDTSDPEYVSQSIVPMGRGVHGGEDVPVYAVGPMSHMFHRVHEQTYVAHVMAHAMCVGPHETCQRYHTSSGARLIYSPMIISSLILWIGLFRIYF